MEKRVVKYFDYDFYNVMLKYGLPIEAHQKLVKFANEFLKEHFNLSLEIPISYNGRLKNTLGQLVVSPVTNRAMKIELSKKEAISAFLMKDFSTIEDVLRHELCHYALFLMDKPFMDGDKYFEDTLIKTNAPSSYAVVKKTNNKRFIKGISYSTIYVDENNNEYAYTNRKAKLRLYGNKFLYADRVKLIMVKE